MHGAKLAAGWALLHGFTRGQDRVPNRRQNLGGPIVARFAARSRCFGGGFGVLVRQQLSRAHEARGQTTAVAVLRYPELKRIYLYTYKSAAVSSSGGLFVQEFHSVTAEQQQQLKKSGQICTTDAR